MAAPWTSLTRHYSTETSLPQKAGSLCAHNLITKMLKAKRLIDLNDGETASETRFTNHDVPNETEGDPLLRRFRVMSLQKCGFWRTENGKDRRAKTGKDLRTEKGR